MHNKDFDELVMFNMRASSPTKLVLPAQLLNCIKTFYGKTLVFEQGSFVACFGKISIFQLN